MSEDMTLDGYEDFASGAHIDSTIITPSVKRGTLGKMTARYIMLYAKLSAYCVVIVIKCTKNLP